MEAPEIGRDPGDAGFEHHHFQARIFENAGSFLIEFQPMAKNLKELYKNINIVIDKKEYTATIVELIEVTGDKTIIRFQNKVLNAPIPDSVFTIP